MKFILILFLTLPTGPTQIIEKTYYTLAACEARAAYYNTHWVTWPKGWVDMAVCLKTLG